MKSNPPHKPSQGFWQADLSLPEGWSKLGSGKVRELYVHKEQALLLMLSTDRISAFDALLPQPIPYKGAVLNQLNAFFLEQAADILPTWMLTAPGPYLMLGHYLKPLPVECVVRGHLSGHAWRLYQAGVRKICEKSLPEGLYPHAALPEPLFTPTSKAKAGHTDQDLSEKEMIRKGLLTSAQLRQVKDYALALYRQGAAHASGHGLRLLDAKYEFGLRGQRLYLIDELHTPDAARYCYEKEYPSYCEAQEKGNKKAALRQLSKEALREQLLQNQSAGTAAQLTPEQVQELSKLYIDLYETLRKKPFSLTGYSTEGSVLQEQAIAGIQSLCTLKAS